MAKRFLLKFVEKYEHAEMLVNGILYCRPARYFRNIELGRGDKGEGSIFPGQCIYTHSNNLIYCLFDTGDICDEYIKIPKQNIETFKPNFIVVMDYEKFDSALTHNFKNNIYEIRAGNVQYGTPTKEFQNEMFVKGIPENLFIKHPYFKYQQEYRVYCADSEKILDFKKLELNEKVSNYCAIHKVDELIENEESFLLKLEQPKDNELFTIIEHPYGNGNSSDRYLIKLKQEYFIIKITDINEPLLKNEFLPKRLSTNSDIFNCLNKENVKYVYQYEFISGQLLSKSVVSDKIFINLIKLLNYFFRNNLLIWDCHIDNFIVKPDCSVIYVDVGGISNINNSTPHYVMDFDCGDEPEEYFYPNYPNSLNTEAFTIYWVAYQLVKRCELNLSSGFKNILNKMFNKNKNNRYLDFQTILKQICSQ